MSRQASRSPKVFTVQEANGTLPLVRAIVDDLVHLARDVVERRQRLSILPADRARQRRDFYQEERSQIEADLDKDMRQLEEYVEELRQIGVEPKSASEGLVDFPSRMDGRAVYLCWKLGEPEILYWHELDAGFSGRRPLTAEIGTAEGLQAEDADD